MDINLELQQTEQRASELRAKLAQLQELEQKKQELLESENKGKLLYEKLIATLEEKKQETIDSLTARNTLIKRIQRLQADQIAYNQQINQEVSELSTEANTLVNQAGESLYTVFVQWWNITNPITKGEINYSVDAISNKFIRDKKLQSDWQRYWQNTCKLITL